MLRHVLEVITFTGFAASAAYTVYAIVCVLRWSAASGRPWTGRATSEQPVAGRPAGTGEDARTPAITMAKPLCGSEPELYENLRSFCEQDYPQYQVVFGVADPADPAAAIARRLIDELPGRDLALVIGGETAAGNRKVASLAAMQPEMKHEIIAVSDSDMRVGRDYLRAIAAEFANERVGAVTCLYRAVPVAPNAASILGAMAINESFLPSVLVARTLQKLRYCFGATMAVRRRELEAIGGFRALASQLADDYMLGKLVTDRGGEVALAPYLVDDILFEPSLRALFEHELRWARTIRSMRPASYAGTILTMPIGWSLAFAAAMSFSIAGWAAIGGAVMLSLTLRIAARATLGAPVPFVPSMMPLRSILTALEFTTAHLGRNVRWKSADLTVAPGGGLSIIPRSKS